MPWHYSTKTNFHSANYCVLWFVDDYWTLIWLPTKLVISDWILWSQTVQRVEILCRKLKVHWLTGKFLLSTTKQNSGQLWRVTIFYSEFEVVCLKQKNSAKDKLAESLAYKNRYESVSWRPWIKFSRSFTQLFVWKTEAQFLAWYLTEKEYKLSINLERGFKSLKQILEEKAWLLQQQGKGKPPDLG